MPVLVSDTSVLIDLERANLLEDIFRLSVEFAVPDLLFKRELDGLLGDRLMQLGLRVESLTPAELSRATMLRRERASLSTPDTFAFAIAESRSWILLSGDGALRDLATIERVEVHGVLWLIDLLADGGHTEFDKLHSGLVAITGHPRCRLPSAEVRRRLLRLAKRR